jgi:hypothetical protein
MRKKSEIIQALSLILLMFFLFNEMIAQTNKKTDTLTQIQETVDSCEDSTATISSVKAYYISEKKNARDSIVIVAYPSEKEDSKKMNGSRLKLAQQGLISVGISKDNIILTEALISSPLPRLDFYVSGRIVGRIITNHNLLFCIECCSN